MIQRHLSEGAFSKETFPERPLAAEVGFGWVHHGGGRPRPALAAEREAPWLFWGNGMERVGRRCIRPISDSMAPGQLPLLRRRIERCLTPGLAQSGSWGCSSS